VDFIPVCSIFRDIVVIVSFHETIFNLLVGSRSPIDSNSIGSARIKGFTFLEFNFPVVLFADVER
jgi:hypothetical protein